MEEKLSLLQQLIGMAQADDELHQREYQLMLRMAELMGVDENDFNALFEQPVESRLPASEFDRILQFHRLVLVANVDHDLSPDERDVLLRCGIKMGLRPEAVEKVLKEIPKHKNGLIPTPIMLQIFQTYHN